MKKAKNIWVAVVLFQLPAFGFAQVPQCTGNGVRLITVTNPAAVNMVCRSIKNKNVSAHTMENKSVSESSCNTKPSGKTNNDDSNFACNTTSLEASLLSKQTTGK